MAAVLLRGGTVVNADGSQRLDVLCKGEKIVALGADFSAALEAKDAHVIDVTGKLLVPGASLLPVFISR